jgi:hypothetical protein
MQKKVFSSVKKLLSKFPMSVTSDEKEVRISDTLSLTEAALMLKFDNFRGVSELIRNKKLRAFKTPFSRNKRVLKSEVEALTIMEEIK